MTARFTGSFTQQEPIPEDAIEAAVRVMRSGRLHRYNTDGDEIAETALLEEEFAELIGAKYCLAVASGGVAMTTALRALGIGPGMRVATNAFTLAPVPGAIAAVGATPVYVEVTDALVIDAGDLAHKVEGCAALLLSHMRGHICDMGAVMAICDAAGVPVIEDCAHTMGATWDGVPSGRFGTMGCYSTQTYKHANSGEGGFVVSDDADAMARAIVLSGSYMMYGRHRAAPPPETFADLRYQTPNVSGRMDNLRAAILRPQLRTLPERAARWRVLYAAMEADLRGVPGLRIIERDPREGFVPSSFQFLLPDWPDDAVRDVVARCLNRGVELKWFGAQEPGGFTSRYSSWRYAPVPDLPATDAVLAAILDMRLPPTFTVEDCAVIAGIVRDAVGAVWQEVGNTGPRAELTGGRPPE